MRPCRLIKFCVAFAAFSFWGTAATAETNIFYDVYRAVPGGVAEFLESVPSSTTTYTDPTVSPGGTYNYWVRVREADVRISEATNSVGDTWEVEIAVPLKVVKNENFPVDISAEKTETGFSPGSSITLEFFEDSGVFGSDLLKTATASGELLDRWFFSVDQGDGLDGQIETFLQATYDGFTFLQTGIIYTDVADSYDAVPANFRCTGLSSGSVGLAWDSATGNSDFSDPVCVSIPESSSEEFTEDWEGGQIDTSIWKIWGSPEPTIVSGGNSIGSYALTSNGDSWYESGVTSLRSFEVVPGLTVRASLFVQAPGTDVWSKRSWHCLELTSRPPDEWGGDSSNAGDSPIGPYVSLRGNTPLETGLALRSPEGTVSFSSSSLVDQWTDIAFRFNEDGSVTYLVNDDVVYTTTSGWIDYDDVSAAYLVCGGRSEGSLVENLHDNIQVYASDYTFSPVVPSNVTATADQPDISVNWNDATGAVEYDVYRSTSSLVSSAIRQATVDQPSYRDAEVTPGAKYYYWVKSKNAYGESDYSSSAIGTVCIAAPTGVTASKIRYDQIDLVWNSVTGATGYQVYRSTSLAGTKSTISTWTNAYSLADVNAVPGVTYYYWVKARRDIESPYSEEATGLRRENLVVKVVITGIMSVMENDTLQCQSIITYSDGTQVSGAGLVEWSIDSEDYATIDPSTGILTTKSVNGDQTCVVTAVYSGVSSGVAYYVRSDPVTYYIMDGDGPSPDLIITNVSYVAGSYQTGDVFSVIASEMNVGDAAASPTFYIQAVLSTSKTWNDPSNVLIFEGVEDEGLNERENYPVTTNITVSSSVPSESYYLGIMIDVGSNVTESVEDNNVWWSEFPDIVINGITVRQQVIDSMSWARIGSPGNPGGVFGRGSVGYIYFIGVHEVSSSQFETAVEFDPFIANGNENYWADSVGSQAPATRMSWHEAARFCNWLTSGNVSNGVYQLDESNLVIGVDRKMALEQYGTVYALPTIDEWHKAAYYTGDGYSDYANGTDEPPIVMTDANYLDSAAPWSVQSGSQEQNGTFNMMGNVAEWCESTNAVGTQYVLGGRYNQTELLFKAGSAGSTVNLFAEFIAFGLRVVELRQDSDEDGLSDLWEIDHFGSVDQSDSEMMCSNSINTLREAYIAGLNPRDPAARFCTGIDDQGLQWDAVSGRVYDVYCTTSLLSGFQCVASNISWASNHFTNTSESPCEYYKIDVRLEE